MFGGAVKLGGKGGRVPALGRLEKTERREFVPFGLRLVFKQVLGEFFGFSLYIGLFRRLFRSFDAFLFVERFFSRGFERAVDILALFGFYRLLMLGTGRLRGLVGSGVIGGNNLFLLFVQSFRTVGAFFGDIVNRNINIKALKHFKRSFLFFFCHTVDTALISGFRLLRYRFHGLCYGFEKRNERGSGYYHNKYENKQYNRNSRAGLSEGEIQRLTDKGAEKSAAFQVYAGFVRFGKVLPEGKSCVMLYEYVHCCSYQNNKYAGFDYFCVYRASDFVGGYKHRDRSEQKRIEIGGNSENTENKIMYREPYVLPPDKYYKEQEYRYREPDYG